MLKITVHNNTNFSAKQLEKYKRAVAMTEKVINTERFKQKFMATKFTNTQGKSNQELYDLMMSGAETLDPIVDNEADVFITMYYKNNSTVGYTYPSVKDTWVNSKFFDQYDEADIGCNLIHEWWHKLGMGHSSASEHTSVPYACGYLVEACIRELIKNPDLYKDSAWDEIPTKPTPVPEPKPEPTPVPEPKPEPVKKKVCKRFWYSFWKVTCWYE